MRISSILKKISEPVIGLAPSAMARGFMDSFFGAKTVLLADLLPRPEILNKCSPKEISGITADIVEGANLDALVLAGSPRRINYVFSEQSKPMFFTDMEVFERSVLKMSCVYEALTRGIALFASCDGMNYLTVIGGGRVEKVGKMSVDKNDPETRIVSHMNDFSRHDVIIPSGSWLYDSALRVTDYTDKNGNIVIPNVSSTHPMYSPELPEHSKVLAFAPDKTPSFVSYFTDITPYVLGIQEHPEVFPQVEIYGESSGKIETQPDLVAYNLYNEISKTFVSAAKLRDIRPLPKSRLSERVLDILKKGDDSVRHHIMRRSEQGGERRVG